MSLLPLLLFAPLYDEIDAILGTRAASQPIVLVDSGADGGTVPQLVDKEALVGMEDKLTSDREDQGMAYNYQNSRLVLLILIW